MSESVFVCVKEKCISPIVERAAIKESLGLTDFDVIVAADLE